MNTKLNISTCVFFVVISLLLACNKNKIIPATEPHIIKARIVEYGTDIPIEGATLSVWTNPGGKINTITNKNGECTLAGDEVAFRTISKEGYWDYNFSDKQFSPIILFPNNSSLNIRTGSVFECDSFVLTLFPKSYITLHIKDSLRLSTCFYCNTFITVNGTYIQNGNNYSVFDTSSLNKIKDYILLRPNIDTTFQYAVFGNAINTFNIAEDDGDDGFGFYQIVRTQKKLIPDKSNLIINIGY
jgi:hypothetical protein